MTSLHSWPEAGLEAATLCPACGSAQRELRHEGLTDITFDAAPGNWNLWQCRSCASLWLDPRPAPSHIHLAYGAYYTHDNAGVAGEAESPSLAQRLRTALANGFINSRFGGKRTPAVPFARLLLSAMPQSRLLLEARYRYLPRLRGEGRLLDIGCGNGNFLALAAELGWQVEGVEPDPAAVSAARSTGLTVFEGGIEHYAGQECLFDEVSISHVIEHVHEPAALLSAAHRLLRPGGRLYLATPNSRAAGFQRFGEAWRGLEVPRHLAIFSHGALHNLVIQAGFDRSADIETVDASPMLAVESGNLARKLGRTVSHDLAHGGASDPVSREFLTIEAWRKA